VTRHMLGLDATTLETDQFRRICDCVHEAVDSMAMSAVTGIAGAGKTHAAMCAREELTGIRTAWVMCSEQPTRRELAYNIVEELTGDRPSGTEYTLLRTILRFLTEHPTVLFIDEAQALSLSCFGLVRRLWDHAASQLAVILIGGDGAWHALASDPMLLSRIYTHVAVRPLGDEAVIRRIPQFHRVWQHTDPELVLDLNEHCAHGVWRNWAKLTRKATSLCGPDACVDEQTAAQLQSWWATLRQTEQHAFKLAAGA